MEEGSLVCFVDSNKTGVYVVDCIVREEYSEKVRSGPLIEQTKNVWHLYELLDKRKKIWKAFEHDIRPHSFERSKREFSSYVRGSSKLISKGISKGSSKGSGMSGKWGNGSQSYVPLKQVKVLRDTFPDAKKLDFKNRTNRVLTKLSEQLGVRCALVLDHFSLRSATALSKVCDTIIVTNPDMKGKLMCMGKCHVFIKPLLLREFLDSRSFKDTESICNKGFGCMFLDFQSQLFSHKRTHADIYNSLECLDFGLYNQGAVFAVTLCKTRGGCSPTVSMANILAYIKDAGFLGECVHELNEGSVVTQVFIVRKTYSV